MRPVMYVTLRCPSRLSPSLRRVDKYCDHLLSDDVADPRYACVSAFRGLAWSGRWGLMRLLQWLHLAEVHGSIPFVQGPGFPVQLRCPLVEMTSRSKGLVLSNFPPSLFGSTSLNFITKLGECKPESEHVVLRLLSNAELPASTNFWEDISERHNSCQVSAHLVGGPLNSLD